MYHRTPEIMRHRTDYAQPEERLLVHLSNFRPVKRIPDVIEIFDRVQKKMPSRLIMIGDGPERSRAEWLAVEKGIHNKIDFLGKQDRIHEKLPLADVLLMPSQLESFGLAALEAMACQVVPIATQAGGVPEVINHGKTGFLAPVGDVDGMAAYAVDILSDQEKLEDMGVSARANAQARFCASKIVPQYEDYYREVLERAS
jgi:N-acetyl-alpha-D-glucosaminyl L-malate synthase BshA